MDRLFDRNSALAGDLEYDEQVVSRSGLERILAAALRSDPGELDDRDPFDGSGGGFSIWDWLE